MSDAPIRLNTEISPKQKKTIPKFALYLLMLAGVFLLEIILRWIFDMFQKQDVFSLALKSYQNSYFSFTPYFTVVQDLGSEYSGNTSSAFRFLISLLIGVPAYGLVLLITGYTKSLEAHKQRITGVAWYAILCLCLFTAFFIPNKKTIFDKEARELVITSRDYFVIPHTTRIPFNEVSEIQYEYSSAYYFSGRVYDLYLKYFITYQGKKIVLADRYLGYTTKLPIGKNFTPKDEMEKEAEEMTAIMNQQLH